MLNNLKRSYSSAIIVIIGTVLTIIHLSHFIEDIQERMPLTAIFGGVLLPLILSIGIIYSGYYILFKSDTEKYHYTILKWFFIGIGILSLTGVGIVLYEIAENARLTHIFYVLLNFVTVGGLLGVLIGWYDAQKESRARRLRGFEKAIEQGGHSIFITDIDGDIEYVNPRFEETTGYSEKEALGKNPRILKSGKQDEKFYEELWNTILSGEIWEGELINKRKNGEYYYIDQTIAPIENKKGEIERFVAINSDITQLKEYEEELEKKNKKLEILNRILRHDIRNDMNIIMMKGEALKDNIEQDSREHIERILKTSDHIIELTKVAKNLIETFEEKKEDKKELEEKELDSILREKIDKAKSAYDNLTISVKQDIPSVNVKGDEMLSSIFTNIFKNAVQHNDKQKPEIDLFFEESKSYITVCIADNGPGIPDDMKDKVFGRGEKGLESKGTGVGLFLVDQLTKRYNGEVWIEDNQPKGTIFKVKLQKTNSEVN